MTRGRAGSPALAMLLGAATTLSFAPVGAWQLGLATLAGLALLWHAATPRASAIAGFAFGLGLYGSGVSWVYVSMHDHGAMPMPLAALATLLFAAYLALWPALAGFLQARLRAGAPGWLLIPAAWCLTEWLRGWVFTGFPWLGVGYAHSDGPLAGLAPIIGVHGLNFCAALLSVLCAGAVHGVAGRTSRRNGLAAALGAALLLATAGGLGRAEWATPHQAPVRVALLQGNVAQDLKFEEGRFESTLESYRRLVEAHPATLIALPETALPRMLQAIPPRYLDDLARLAKARDSDLIFGVPFAESQSRYFNSVVTLGASSSQRYDKAHLVPFGEFIPFGFRWFVDAMKIPLGDFTSGSATPQALALGAQRIAVNICYEDLFGEEIIRQLPAATILLNVSNIAWFGASLAPHQHLQISRMRALETSRPMLRATNTGMTAVIDHRGRVLRTLPAFTEGALLAAVQGYSGTTPYTRFGNWPMVSLSLSIVAWAAWRRRPSQARPQAAKR